LRTPSERWLSYCASSKCFCNNNTSCKYNCSALTGSYKR
jgi:hypothetical protein